MAAFSRDRSQPSTPGDLTSIGRKSSTACARQLGLLTVIKRRPSTCSLPAELTSRSTTSRTTSCISGV
jgi:hypothetical protein